VWSLPGPEASSTALRPFAAAHHSAQMPWSEEPGELASARVETELASGLFLDDTEGKGRREYSHDGEIGLDP
jgi:hypothetical protein